MNNKVKQSFKIIFANLITILLLIFVAEFYCIYKEYKTCASPTYTFNFHLDCLLKSYKNFNYINTSIMRGPSFPQNKSEKAPLAIMGCSFAYGLGLKEDETLAAQLSSSTDRIVYNLGVIGGSPREMLYILRNDKLRQELFGDRTDFEYIIYPYIAHHLFRLYNQIKLFSLSPTFRKVGNSLEFYEVNKILLNSQLYQEIVTAMYGKINKNETFDLLCLYFEEINKEINKHFPNAKFVVLVYENYPNNDFSKINNKEIKVIDFQTLTGINLCDDKYKISKEDSHPNAKAWEVIVPTLVKELNL